MRLTNAIRNTIVKNAIEHRFASEIAAHTEARAKFGQALYDGAYKIDADIIQAECTSDEWYEKSKDISITHPDFENLYHYVSRSDNARLGDADDKEHSRFELSRAVVMPKHNPHVKIAKGNVLYEQAKALAKSGNELRKAIDKAKSELRTLLRTFGTTKNLFEAWPEGERFLDSTPAPVKSKALVPADLAARINDMLGLRKLA